MKPNLNNLPRDYKILHIASHTSMDNEIPTLSSIELSPGKDAFNDGVLYSYELYQLQLNAQLIVLSGCNTGMGQLKQGEGLLSLVKKLFLQWRTFCGLYIMAAGGSNRCRYYDWIL